MATPPGDPSDADLRLAASASDEADQPLAPLHIPEAGTAPRAKGDSAPSPNPTLRQFPCVACGAGLTYQPGSTQLVCAYCGAVNPIPEEKAQVREIDYHATLAELEAHSPMIEQQVVPCQTCGARTTLPPNVTSGLCVFCGQPIVATGQSIKQIKPHALLPFTLDRGRAYAAFRQWLGGLWFAPEKISRLSQQPGSLMGIYLPFWTYDSDATTDYTGRRGDDYYVTRTRTVMRNGKPSVETYQERHTRWRHVAGRVFHHFDDLLIFATGALPEAQIQPLAPWDLAALVPYQDEYLSGFEAQSYTVDLPTGFDLACQRMVPTIRSGIAQDIGGDHQEIDQTATQYGAITFKHILLPVWISAFQYEGKTYRIMVNARTGKVHGERPWDTVKILLAVGLGLVGLVILLGILLLMAGGLNAL